MFDAVKSLLLDGDDERAIDEQCSRGIVIYRVNSENVHGPPLLV
jgi:hypothetical protein